jgi:hypothetical protein
MEQNSPLPFADKWQQAFWSIIFDRTFWWLFANQQVNDGLGSLITQQKPITDGNS